MKSLFGEEEPNSDLCDNDKEGYVIRVAFEAGVDNEFDYGLDDELWPIEIGQRVEVPFGRANKIVRGFCVALQDDKKKWDGRLKRVLKVIDEAPLVDVKLMELARWISSYYVCPLGQVLGAIVPSAVKRAAGVKEKELVYIAESADDLITQLRGKKQKQVVEFLNSKKAIDKNSAVESKQVCQAVGCTRGPVKRLSENHILTVFRKTVLKALPVIPAELAVKNRAVILNDEQNKVLEHVRGKLESGQFAVTLLHGVTDSGKTEIYIKAIEQTLKKGKSAIVLLPEIALTAQTVSRFNSRFERIAVMHSGLTAAQRNVQWRKIKTGQADVVIGARSAVFAPLNNLGLIIVDEEHEPSYKQDTLPRYNGRDVAIKRTQLCAGHCLLGSATPSLEMLHNCKEKKHFSLVRLTKRVMNLPVPQMRLVDLKTEYSTSNKIQLISERLGGHLREVLAKKEQAILLLNRRGYSNFVFCPSCRHTLRCRNCDVSLTFHKSNRTARMQTVAGEHMHSGSAICHYCGSKTLVPRRCPLCAKQMTMIGLGSQRLEEELKEKFGQAKVARIDSDAMRKSGYYGLLKDFSDGKIDILAGTQMLAKGLHFPNVTLVGIISADTSLYLPDFRANERTFQLICQVAGRAGRSKKKGIVFVQTFLAEQPAIQFALSNDYKGFAIEELKHRKACNLPPFWRLAVVGLRDMNFEKLQSAAKVMRQRIEAIAAGEKLAIVVRGPMEAIISRIQRFHRMQIIIQGRTASDIQRLFGALRVLAPIKPAVKVTIDVDPVNLL